MSFTVAICTWNRAPLLRRSLECLTRLAAPRGSWDLVVVDNGSTDDTGAVLEAFADRLPLRRAVEAEPGLSHARNAAVRAASGDYVAWIDDDVQVGEGWLRAYERAAACWPEAAVFGGPIRPRFEGTPPDWLTRNWRMLEGVYATRELGPEPVAFDGRDAMPYGANYVVRMKEQRELAYDPERGRRGVAGRLGEETALIVSILGRGGSGRWVPDAAVEHWIPKERQTLRYVRRYFELVGRSRPPEPRDRQVLWGRPRWVWRQALRAEARYRLSRLTRESDEWVERLVAAAKLWGIEAR